LSWPFFDLGLLFCRKLCLELPDNRLRKLALNREQICRSPIVGLRPDMRVGASVDQLCVNAEPVPRPLDGTFNDIGNPELFTDLAQVPLHTGLVLPRARVTNDLQIED